ncbi:hypothetical protein QJS66_12755 [Kocuria rhizophila]|nr:hypothetical protein QJS66_12755 [Kocuria rhizophila]
MVLAKAVLTILATVAVLGIIAVPMDSCGSACRTAAARARTRACTRRTNNRAGEVRGEKCTVVAAAYLPDGTTEEQAQDLQVDLGEQLREQEHVSAVVPAAISKDHSTLATRSPRDEGPAPSSTTDLVNSLGPAPGHPEGM